MHKEQQVRSSPLRRHPTGALCCRVLAVTSMLFAFGSDVSGAEPESGGATSALLPRAVVSIEGVGGLLSQSGGGGLQATFELSRGIDIRVGTGLHMVGALDPVRPIEWSGSWDDLPEQSWKLFGVLTTTSHIGWTFPLERPVRIGPVLSLDTLFFVEGNEVHVGSSKKQYYLTNRYGCWALGPTGINMLARWATRGPVFALSAGVATSCYDDFVFFAPRLDVRVHEVGRWSYGIHLDPRSLLFHVGRTWGWPSAR